MSEELPYKDGNALWAAISARAKTEAKNSGTNAGSLLRGFVVDRFLARVFTLPGEEWVLKAATPSSCACTTPERRKSLICFRSWTTWIPPSNSCARQRHLI